MNDFKCKEKKSCFVGTKFRLQTLAKQIGRNYIISLTFVHEQSIRYRTEFSRFYQKQIQQLNLNSKSIRINVSAF